MDNRFRLILNGHACDARALEFGEVPPDIAEVPQYRAAWQFCRDWLSGRQRFDLQTSGSTGAPKRIQARKAQLLESALSTGRFLGYRPGDRSLLCLNAAFIGGIMVLVRGLVFGFEVTVLAPAADSISRLAEDHLLDHVSLSPLQLRHAVSQGAYPLKRFKTVLIGGADLDAALLQDAAQIAGPRLYQTFGMTETLSHFALRCLNAPKPEPFYTAFVEVQIHTNPDSEMVVDWPGVTDGPVQTHDLVEIVAPGRFVWKGRTDFTINSGGIKVQPEEVEACARGILSDVIRDRRELVALPVPDVHLGQKVVLALEGEPLPQAQVDLLIKLMKEALPAYHAPKAIHFLAGFARTPTGKPNRRAILMDLQAQVGLDAAQAGG